ncbi:hypothetical protein [Streptomyces graminilatus]|uniref:hypothetical protein n=1 Tax=Streptomyces graminilatus TaxID=1464070 RepID=UPI0012FF2B00|nr:hypothetical protein [Streptomyces graminilatus]
MNPKSSDPNPNPGCGSPVPVDEGAVVEPVVGDRVLRSVRVGVRDGVATELQGVAQVERGVRVTAEPLVDTCVVVVGGAVLEVELGGLPVPPLVEKGPPAYEPLAADVPDDAEDAVDVVGGVSVREGAAQFGDLFRVRRAGRGRLGLIDGATPITC